MDLSRSDLSHAAGTPLIRSPRGRRRIWSPRRTYASGEGGGAIVAAALVGTGASIAGIVFPFTVGPDSDGLEGLWLLLGMACLPFFGPSLLFAVTGSVLRNRGMVLCAGVLLGLWCLCAAGFLVALG